MKILATENMVKSLVEDVSKTAAKEFLVLSPPPEHQFEQTSVHKKKTKNYLQKS